MFCVLLLCQAVDEVAGAEDGLECASCVCSSWSLRQQKGYEYRHVPVPDVKFEPSCHWSNSWNMQAESAVSKLDWPLDRPYDKLLIDSWSDQSKKMRCLHVLLPEPCKWNSEVDHGQYRIRCTDQLAPVSNKWEPCCHFLQLLLTYHCRRRLDGCWGATPTLPDCNLQPHRIPSSELPGRQ